MKAEILRILIASALRGLNTLILVPLLAGHLAPSTPDALGDIDQN